MHPLLRRLLMRGPFMFLAIAGLAWFMGWFAERYFEGLERGSTASTLWSVTQFGLIGTAVYAVLEWISYVREKNKANLPNNQSEP
jgi:high-affinity Fe2+/Pb2+ permease